MTVQEFQRQFGIIGNSKEIRDLADIVMQVAPSDITVLIHGESGVGKEVFARAIHGYSNRKDQPLISVNAGAIPEGLLESELFGHKKGAFTGAIGERRGYFELADQGTLFLDEIAEMPIAMQVKLLRAIESKEFLRIGAETITKVNLRFIAASNKDLQAEVEAKRFREDLYFRLKAVSLSIPPLRKRRGDIIELTHHFVRRYEEEQRTGKITITNEALEILERYPWPGNVRELKNAIETAIALSRDGILRAESFHQLIPAVTPQPARNLPSVVGKSTEELNWEFVYRALFELKRDILEIKDMITAQVPQKPQRFQPNEETPEGITDIEELEKRAILTALRKSKGNKRRAAGLLNMSERTLYRKMKEYDLYNF